MTTELRISRLTQALLLARRACAPTVYKAGRNSHQNYRYVGHEQVLVSGAREALLSNGLILEQRSVTLAGELVIKAGSERERERAVWRWTGVFALVHESGEERLYTFEATTQPNDKAAFVASTSLDRVAHLRLLELAGSDEEDPEHDSHDLARKREEQAAAPAEREPVRAPQQAPQGAQAPQKAVDGVTQLIRDLAMLKNKDQLVSWAGYLLQENASTETKAKAWAAFGKRCEDLKEDPREVATLARRKGV